VSLTVRSGGGGARASVCGAGRGQRADVRGRDVPDTGVGARRCRERRLCMLALM
jgi:hypothetical protein